MPERFTEILRAASEPAWSDAVGHRFVKELFAGAVPDAVMARYLIQDHRFLDSFLTLLGAALASADTFEARVRFGRFIGMVAGEENTFFLRAFEALGVTEDGPRAIPIRSRLPASRRSCAKPQKRAAMPPRFLSSSWPSGSISTGPPARRSRYRTTSCTPSGSCCTTIRIFATSSVSCARSWTGSAPRRRICAATFSVALSPSNSPFSKPPTPTGPDIDVFDRVKCPEPEKDRGFESCFLQRRVSCEPDLATLRTKDPVWTVFGWAA
jgi:hypothetical protein